MDRKTSKSRPLASITLLVIFMVISLVVPTQIPSVHGAGNMYVDPHNQPVQPKDIVLTYTVKVSGMDSFNGWKIIVKVDQTVLNPKSVSIANSILTGTTEFVNCVNAGANVPTGQPGNLGCDINDFPGTIHSEVVGGRTANGASGLLFTMTFTVVGGTFAPIHISTDCLANTTADCLVHSTIDGEYGTAPGLYPVAQFDWTPPVPREGDKITFNATASRDTNPGLLSHSTGTITFHIVQSAQDFIIAPSSPVTINTIVNSAATQTVTITSTGGYNNVIALTETPAAGIACQLSPTTITGSGSSTLSCSASGVGDYQVTVKGQSGTLIHSTAPITFHVTASPTPDFTISPTTPVSVSTSPGTAGTQTITVTAINGFTSPVSLTATNPSSGLTCQPLPSVTGSGTSTLSCTASSAGDYTVTVTGSSGSLSHQTALITIVVTSSNQADFHIIPSGNTVVNGLTGVVATQIITLAGIGRLNGTINLAVATLPSGLTCQPLYSVTLPRDGTSTLSCSTLTPGDYSLTVTATISGIVSYTWHFGDTTADETTTNPYIDHLYTTGGGITSLIGNFTVILSVSNKFGLRNSVTHVVPVSKKPGHDLSIDNIFSPETDSVSLGTVIHLQVRTKNNGTFVEKGYNLTVIFPNKRFTVNYTGLLAGSDSKLDTFPWPTAGMIPGSYEIAAFVAPVRNATTGAILETNLINNNQTHIIRLYTPLSTSTLSLSMVQSFGVVTVVIAGAVAAWKIVTGRVRRERIRRFEALP
ncbi:MAG TPA: PKD domain-containing protein [Candidatus Bathyarchaeia archaeon]|nr:PKD domain-containing protein [Candidatus Bathyarchaeia archaeon]